MLNDVVEVGAVNYIYQKTAWMRCRLQKYFPDIWQYVYAAAIIHAAYYCCFRRMQLHYEDSILSYIYPDLSFTPGSVTEFLNTLGRMRGAIRGYMQEMVAEHIINLPFPDIFIAFCFIDEPIMNFQYLKCVRVMFENY